MRWRGPQETVWLKKRNLAPPKKQHRDPKKTNPEPKRGSKIKPTFVHAFVGEQLNSLQKRGPKCVDTFSRAGRLKWQRFVPKMETVCVRPTALYLKIF